MDRTIKIGACALLAAAAATWAGPAPVRAQGSDIEALRAQIQALQDRLDKIESDQVEAKEKAKNAPMGVSSKFPLVISGLLQVHGLGTLQNDAGSPGRADTFRLRRGELRLTAPRITDRLSGAILFDPAKSQNGAAANGVLQEIQLSYLLNKGKSGSHYLDIGQFKIPIGYEGDLVSSSALQTVERALMYQGLSNDPVNGRYGDVRDSGAQLRGTVGQFDYRLAMFNGLGERQNQLSTSDNKALVGRLVFKPAHVKGLQLGISGGIDGARNVALAGAPVNQALNRKVLNAFTAYQKDKLTLQAEYLKADFTANQAATTRNRSGYYGSVGWLFTPRIEGVARYDIFDTDVNLPNTSTREMTLGVNYYLKGDNAKIQANVVKVDPPTTGGASNSRTELRTNFQIAF